MDHPLLVRQLRRLGLDPGRPPRDVAEWRTFLERVGKAYREADEDRYLLERSLRMSSDEMQELNDSLRRDLAERQAIQEALERERRQLLSIIRNAPIPIAMFDTEMRYLAWSARWLEDYGLGDAEVAGRSHYEVFPDVPERWREIHRRALDGEVLTQAEDVFERADGSRLSVRWAIHPWCAVDGRVGGVVLVTDRIDDLVEAREQALEAARLKAEFLANMSHEIRTPVHVVIGMTDMLLESSLAPEQRDCAATVRRSAVNLLAILNDVLDFSKIEAGRVQLERQDFDPRTVLEEVVELLGESAHRKGIEIDCLAGAEVPRLVTGDPGRLRQILLNLVGNAVKFTEHGDVIVTAGIESLGNGRVEVRFDVRDTGIGIAPGQQARIFEAFVQADGSMSRKYGGTGLGLAISKQLVTLLGGRIGVEGAPGKGSLFWFTAAFEEAAHDADRPSSLPLRGLRVLVVDGHETTRRLMRARLEQWAARVAVALDGDGALQVLAAAAAAGNPFDVVLAAVELGDSDGLALPRALRADPALATTACVVLVPTLRRIALQAARDAGAELALARPVSEARLRDALEAAVAARRARRRAGGEPRAAEDGDRAVGDARR
jgi:PAS domain S-box-containing protein